MRVGLIGSGNMARALARGWGEPVLCTDGGSGRAATLAAEVGGEALMSNGELAERADVVILCHKPYQLEAVADQVAGRARAVVSVLGAVPVAALRAAYPATPVFRAMPNTPVEVRQGVTALCDDAPGADGELREQIRELFGRVGTVVELPEKLMDAATATSGVMPAYLAVIAEAQIDASVRAGIKADIAAGMVLQAIAGSAALLQARDADTLSVRREVTSPGGSTARGLRALDHAGLRAAFSDALDAVIGGTHR
jgi:pyrroline-5-carboxylate reductase